MTDHELLRRAAERAGRRSFFLAAPLLAYARAERLDDAGLAERLGCDPARLPALLLCRRPGWEGSVFRADVEAIAERFDLKAVRLARVLRDADVLVALAGPTPARPGGLLAAARDREAGEESQADPAADQPRPPAPASPAPDEDRP